MVRLGGDLLSRGTVEGWKTTEQYGKGAQTRSPVQLHLPASSRSSAIVVTMSLLVVHFIQIGQTQSVNHLWGRKHLYRCSRSSAHLNWRVVVVYQFAVAIVCSFILESRSGRVCTVSRRRVVPFHSFKSLGLFTVTIDSKGHGGKYVIVLQ
jgi:hypothetical protein